jgi:hypothetical protein
MSQPNYPFKYSVEKLVTRQEFEPDDYEEEEKLPNAIFLLEGSQLRYGSRAAWSA